MDKRTSTNGNKVLGYIAKLCTIRAVLLYDNIRQCIKSSCDWTVYTVILCE